MRIISGKFKGKKLLSFDFDSTRPTSDLIKQVLFDCLGKHVENSKFLDLFAGTGAIGIEALSRNAINVIFVDDNFKSIDLIKKNIYSLNVNNYSIIKSDYMNALKDFKKQNICFDFIFIDPPYATNFAENSIEYICKNNILNQNGIIVWEHDKSKLDYKNDYTEQILQKKQGIKFLTFLKIKQKENE